MCVPWIYYLISKGRPKWLRKKHCFKIRNFNQTRLKKNLLSNDCHPCRDFQHALRNATSENNSLGCIRLILRLLIRPRKRYFFSILEICTFRCSTSCIFTNQNFILYVKRTVGKTCLLHQKNYRIVLKGYCAIGVIVNASTMSIGTYHQELESSFLGCSNN